MLRGIFSFLRGIFALFFRSLRTDSRSIRIHLMWFLLMIVIYGSLWVAREMSAMFGAPGLFFFRIVMYLNAGFITLLGITFFSNAISEEKEEDTLGLMTMAGISPLGLLLGKSTSRLFQVVLLLAIQYPFTLLAVTMGGLLPTQIFSAYMSLLAYTILLANVGLICSVACRTSRNASGLTTLWLVGYLSAPLFALAGHSYLTTERNWSEKSGFIRASVLTCLNWIFQSPVYIELYAATETGHRFTWSAQLISNSVGGVVLFLLAWILFGYVAKEPELDGTERGMVARRTNRRLSWFSAGRTWRHPLVWKDFFFVAGGWAGLLIRCLLYCGLFGLCYGANSSWYVNSGISLRWPDVVRGFQVFAHPLLALDIALCASRVFQEEIKGQTLASLLMLPQSIPSIVYSKFGGCALASTPGVIALLCSLALPGGTEFIGELFRDAGLIWWIMNLVLVIHLTAVFSIYLRSGAFVLAIGGMICSMVLSSFVDYMIAVATRGMYKPQEIHGHCAIGLAVICIACHGIILWRMPSLGEK